MQKNVKMCAFVFNINYSGGNMLNIFCDHHAAVMDLIYWKNTTSLRTINTIGPITLYGKSCSDNSALFSHREMTRGGLGPVSPRLMTSQFKDILTHTQKMKTVNAYFAVF